MSEDKGVVVSHAYNSPKAAIFLISYRGLTGREEGSRATCCDKIVDEKDSPLHTTDWVNLLKLH